MNQRILVIASAFNELIVRHLVQGCEAELADQGLGRDSVRITWVPGAFEVPVLAARAARSGKFDAIIALGAVIRGETPHFDYVAGEAARGIMDVSVKTGIPVIFGILTTDNADQAIARCGIKGPNKGREAAAAAVIMLKRIQELGIN